MDSSLRQLQNVWESRWPEALAVWSRFTKLSAPRWCVTAADEKCERLSGSFAMIRLNDHAVVISLRQVREQGLDDYALEILAHEIGHHVLCPADLSDHARTIARMRYALPSRESFAPMVANLYTDLLINDRLQRSENLRLAEIYQILRANSEQSGEASGDRLWTLYMRIYEILWSLPKSTLAGGAIDNTLEADAGLGARLVRVYGRDWLRGAGRFAALCLPYLLEKEDASQFVRVWLDTRDAGVDGLPDGLVEIDPDEISGAIHPALDPELSGIRDDMGGTGRNLRGGAVKEDAPVKEREPFEYGAILKSPGVELSDHEIAVRYYRERALPHLVRFPVREMPEATEPAPEGLEEWDLGSPLEQIDWLQTAIQSPHVIPGLTTVQRTYGLTSGPPPEREPLGLYLGVDCSGSMINPQTGLSYPVLAGAIVVLSALRVGARVKIVLSGEPGESASTDGFVTDEHSALKMLTGYLGTGYAFGIHRLQETFAERGQNARAAHLLIITDSDIFTMLEQNATTDAYGAAKTGRGWIVARDCLVKARGGGTYVLHMTETPGHSGVERMKQDGWNVQHVRDWPDIIAFAREFSRANYEKVVR